MPPIKLLILGAGSRGPTAPSTRPGADDPLHRLERRQHRDPGRAAEPLRQTNLIANASSSQENLARSALMKATPIEKRNTAGTTRARSASCRFCWYVKSGAIRRLWREA